MRRLIKGFDRVVCWALGVHEFSSEPGCVLRIRLTRTRRALVLPGGIIPPGAPVVELHLWNERLPQIPPPGADIAWARVAGRSLAHSLRSLASHLQQEPSLRGVRAIGGATVLVKSESSAGGAGLVSRLGFHILPYHHALGRFAEFWENTYTWALMGAFNRASLRRRSFLRLRRVEIWMTAEEFLRRFGSIAASSPGHGRPSGSPPPKIA